MILWFVLFFLILITTLFLILYFKSKDKIFSLITIPELKYALVLGAGLERNGEPSDLLADRVLSACQLIKGGKTKFMIMSGTKSGKSYNEPASMKLFATSYGIDDDYINVDDYGLSTLDSLINFKKDHLEEDLIIVTQFFHLPRALWLANKLKLNAYGYPASIFHFSISKRILWYLREFFAIPYNLIKLQFFSKKINKS